MLLIVFAVFAVPWFPIGFLSGSYWVPIEFRADVLKRRLAGCTSWVAYRVCILGKLTYSKQAAQAKLAKHAKQALFGGPRAGIIHRSSIVDLNEIELACGPCGPSFHG